MQKFRLNDAIIEDGDGCTSRFYRYGDWFMIYEWLCRKYLEWGKEKKYEILNATSSINNGCFYEIYSLESPVKRIAYFLRYGFYKHQANPFLKYLKINKWADLDRLIIINGRRPKDFPNRKWFELYGRLLNYSPNHNHPKARYVQNFSLQFDRYEKLWKAKLYYSYAHNSSSWSLSLYQKRKEHLDTFAGRIDSLIGDILIPETLDEERRRLQDERQWHCSCVALKKIFYERDFPFFEKELSDMLNKIQGTSLSYARIFLTKQRLRTLKKWIVETIKDSD